MPGVGSSKRLRGILDEFLAAPPARFPRTVESAKALQDQMAADGIEQARAGGAAPGLLSGPRGRSLRKKIGNLEKKVANLQDALSKQQGKAGGRITMLWWVRAGLSPPGIPLRQVHEFLASCSSTEQEGPLSHTSVAAARDAFAEVLRALNRADLTARCRPGLLLKKPVLIQHLHDEASLRIRSHKHEGGKLARGRTSSIQTHSIEVRCGEAQCEFWTEMQALWSKDSSSSVTCI